SLIYMRPPRAPPSHTPSLHDALPILVRGNIALTKVDAEYTDTKLTGAVFEVYKDSNDNGELDSEDELIGTLTEKEIGQYEMNDRSEEHTSELQSRFDLVCRLLLEKKK